MQKTFVFSYAMAYLEGDGQIDDYQRVCNAMIEQVLERGAKDNVTCVLVRCTSRSGGV